MQHSWEKHLLRTYNHVKPAWISNSFQHKIASVIYHSVPFEEEKIFSTFEKKNITEWPQTVSTLPAHWPRRALKQRRYFFSADLENHFQSVVKRRVVCVDNVWSLVKIGCSNGEVYYIGRRKYYLLIFGMWLVQNNSFLAMFKVNLTS